MRGQKSACGGAWWRCAFAGHGNSPACEHCQVSIVLVLAEMHRQLAEVGAGLVNNGSINAAGDLSFQTSTNCWWHAPPIPPGDGDGRRRLARSGGGREYGIPAVVGVADATMRLRDGQSTTVDRAVGTIAR